MRALLAALGAVLAFAGCATARYAEVWHKKPQLTGPPGNGRLATVEERLDRKSTRLNSSHRTISYAVFCLKKKTQNNNKKSTSQSRLTQNSTSIAKYKAT